MIPVQKIIDAAAANPYATHSEIALIAGTSKGSVQRVLSGNPPKKSGIAVKPRFKRVAYAGRDPEDRGRW